MRVPALTDIQNNDIYLVDQILKGRYSHGGKILDAGCGSGRNLSWFVLQPNIDMYATDANAEATGQIFQAYPHLKAGNIVTGALQNMPFSNNYFDHIICSAVLHFAHDTSDFLNMFSQLYRVLKTRGSLFIRVASDFGIENQIIPLGNGRYFLPDGTERFLLTKLLLQQVFTQFSLELAEPVKTTNVQDMRCMTTLVLLKKG